MSKMKLRELIPGPFPGGTVRSNSGAAIEISANGTSSVPAKQLESVLFKRFAEMQTAVPEAHPLTDSDSE